MEPIGTLLRFKKNTRLHTKQHVLAEDLSRGMNEPKRFAAYLGIAQTYHEDDLRTLMRYVLEKRDLPSNARGRYFFASLAGLKKDMAKSKKHHEAPTSKKRRAKRKHSSDRPASKRGTASARAKSAA